MKIIITVFLCAWVIFQLYFSTLGAMNAVTLRAFHCMFLLLFTFLLYPATEKQNRMRMLPPITDMLLIAFTVLTFIYFLTHYTEIARIGGRINTFQTLLAAIALVIIFEAARRTSKNHAILAAFFFAYNFYGKYIPGPLGHNGFTLKRILITQFWGTQGIFCIGIGVSATYIFLFIVFGAFLKHSGFSKFINDFSLALAGQTSGGPAKVAVLSSALMGMINGSAVANVATTGTITIPLMKQTGYKKEFAAAVEATASTGGQFCPPIMGAIGFVMAEFLNISYTKVMLAAIVPACLYYLGILVAVHFEAKRLGLHGLAKEHLPNAANVVQERGHLMLPIVLLIAMMLRGYTPLISATAAIFATIGASWIRKDTRMTFDKIICACVEGAQSAITVGVSCIIIGIIIGTVTLTSLGINMGYVILNIVPNSSIYLTGFLTMIIAIILGMGVPGVAAYVIVQTVATPILIKAGVIPIAAHMFCLIYACLSNITPPVAISCYVAAGIADANQLQTGLLAVRIGLIGFLLPFFFLNNPVLLIGASENVALAVSVRALLTAAMGTVSLVAGLEGQLLKPCSFVERCIFIAIAALLLVSSIVSDIIGFALFAAICIYQATKNHDKKLQK